MTARIKIFCSIYRKLDTAYCDDPVKSELLLTNQFLNCFGMCSTVFKEFDLFSCSKDHMGFGNTTQYQYDDFARRIKVISPDTGTDQGDGDANTLYCLQGLRNQR